MFKLNKWSVTSVEEEANNFTLTRMADHFFRRRTSIPVSTPTNTMALREQIKSAVEINSRALDRRYDELLKEHGSCYVLMRKERPVGFYSDENKAVNEGRRSFPDRLFSVHELTGRPRHVGTSASLS